MQRQFFPKVWQYANSSRMPLHRQYGLDKLTSKRFLQLQVWRDSTSQPVGPLAALGAVGGRDDRYTDVSKCAQSIDDLRSVVPS